MREEVRERDMQSTSKRDRERERSNECERGHMREKSEREPSIDSYVREG